MAEDLDDLKELLLTLSNERDRRYEQRFNDQETAVAAALQAAKEAVAKAEIAAEKRFDAVNEFRGQLSDQAATFIPRLEMEQQIAAMREKIEALSTQTNNNFVVVNSRLDNTQGEKKGTADSRAAMYAFTGFLVGLIMLGGFVTAVWPK